MSLALSRQQLYDRVWGQPIQKLSREFGLSDVGLAKVCRRYGIPVPPRGYWARKQAGQQVRQLPLPATSPDGRSDTITFTAQRRPQAELGREQPPRCNHPSIEMESEPTNKIEPPREDLRITHALLRSTRDYWKAMKRPSRFWPSSLPQHFNIAISDTQHARALRVLQALFSAFEKRQYPVTAGERGEIIVKVLGETCRLVVRERQRQVRVERRRTGDPNLHKDKAPTELVYTGELEVRVDGRFGQQASAIDAPSSRVEDQLNDVIANLVKAALAEKDFLAKQEQAKQAAIERERERAMAQRLEQEEQARIGRLDELAQLADRRRRLMAFRDELRATVGEFPRDSELGRWLDWIDSYLETLDVFRSFRQPSRLLVLHYCVSKWRADEILRSGFGDGDSDRGGSVAFTDVPMRGIYGDTICIVIEAPEHAVLPYESLIGRKPYREFALPPNVANAYTRRAVTV